MNNGGISDGEYLQNEGIVKLDMMNFYSKKREVEDNDTVTFFRDVNYQGTSIDLKCG